MSLSVLNYPSGHNLIKETQDQFKQVLPEIELGAKSQEQRIINFITNTEEKLKNIEYQLIMQAKDLEHVCLTDKLNQGYLNGNYLFNSQLKGFSAKSPNMFIQKIRTIYFLILFIGIMPIEVLQQNRDKDTKITCEIIDIRILTKKMIVKIKRAFILLKLQIYKSQKIPRSSKKLFAEFIQFLNFDVDRISDESFIENNNEEQNQAFKLQSIITTNINKYQFMDEILIDAFLEEILKPIHWHKTTDIADNIDDNFIIVQYLYDKLGISCQFLMFRQFILQEQILITVGTDCMKFANNTDYFQLLENQIKQNLQNQQVSLNLIDVSNVRQFSNTIFSDMQKSFILELQEFKDQPENISQTSLEFIPWIDQKQQKRSSIEKICEEKPKSSAELFKSSNGSRKGLIRLPASFSIREISALSTEKKPEIFKSTLQFQSKLSNLPDLPSKNKISWKGQPIDYTSLRANASVTSLQFINQEHIGNVHQKLNISNQKNRQKYINYQQQRLNTKNQKQKQSYINYEEQKLQKSPVQENYKNSRFNEAFFEQIQKQINDILIQIRQKFDLKPKLESPKRIMNRMQDTYNEKIFQNPLTSYQPSHQNNKTRYNQLKQKLGYKGYQLNPVKVSNEIDSEKKYYKNIPTLKKAERRQSLHFLGRKQIQPKLNSINYEKYPNIGTPYYTDKNKKSNPLIFLNQSTLPKQAKASQILPNSIEYKTNNSISTNQLINITNPQYAIKETKQHKQRQKPKYLNINTLARPSSLKIAEKSPNQRERKNIFQQNYRVNQIKVQPTIKISSNIQFKYLQANKLANERVIRPTVQMSNYKKYPNSLK